MAVSQQGRKTEATFDSSSPRVAFFSADWSMGPTINLGGSDYWRLALPAAKLFENDWDAIFARNLAEGPDGRILVQDPAGDWRDDREVIVIQRWMAEGTAERILRAREAGQIIINEVDDDYWSFPEGHISRNTTDPEQNSERNWAHYRETIAASSLVTVSTPYLAEALKDWGAPVRLLRNFIDFEWWKPLPPGDFVGWVGGLPWRDDDMSLLRETVVPWLRERKQFFYHGGAVHDIRMEEKLGYDRITWRWLCQIPQYPSLWEPLRVALIPMKDSPFNAAKSYIKGLEAAARGIPFIHSPHPEYEQLGVGLCANEPGDWTKWLGALTDPNFYAEQVDQGRQRAAELDLGTHWRDWADVLREAVKVG